MAKTLPTIIIEQDADGTLKAYSAGRFYPMRIIFCSATAPCPMSEEQSDARFSLKQGKVNGRFIERPLLIS